MPLTKSFKNRVENHLRLIRYRIALLRELAQESEESAVYVADEYEQLKLLVQNERLRALLQKEKLKVVNDD